MVEFRHAGSAKGGLILEDDQRGKESGRERKEVAIESGGEKARMVEEEDDSNRARIHWPLLGVESNINEKSEAFIERKKKAMIKNFTLDQDHNKK